MTYNFNIQNCIVCPSSIGQIKKRESNLVVQQCELQQAISEGRLDDALTIGTNVEDAFAKRKKET